MAVQKARTVLDLAKARLHAEDETRKSLTTKAAIMISVATFLLTQEPGRFAGNDVVFALGYTALAVAVLCGVIVVFPKTDFLGPKLKQVQQVMSDHEYETALEWLADAMDDAHRRNSKNNTFSANALCFGLCALALSSVAFLP